MRETFGILVLFAGWVVLGMTGSGTILKDWDFGMDAVEIEDYIRNGAQAKIGKTTYGVETSVSGRDIVVSGTVASDIERAAILANLDDTHGRRRVLDNLTQIAIATPYIFRGSKTADGMFFSGNAPTQNTLANIIGSADSDLTLAGGMPSTQWPDFVGTGVRGISMLQNGAFDISNRHISVSGLARTLEEEKAVRQVFATLPAGYTASVDLKVVPTIPYVFSGTKNGTTETFGGYVPSAAARGGLAGLIGDAAQELKPTAGMPDENWMSVVGVGIQALKGLNDGELSVVDRRVQVVGSVNTSEAVDAIENLFSVMPEGYSAHVSLTSEDDGTPARLNLNWVAGNGGTINGKGPEGVSMGDLTSALNLPKLGGIFRQGSVSGKEIMLQRLSSIGAALPLFESVKTSVDENSATFEGVLLPGGDMEIAKSTLTQTLGSNATINLTRSLMEPREGDTRINADTGKNEILQGGFWKVIAKVAAASEPATKETQTTKPVIVSTATGSAIANPEITALQRCTAHTANVTEDAKITYETASATLTANSLATLRKLSDIMIACAEIDGLSVEVAGHTDSQGSEAFNQKLSLERANSVRTALIDLGINQTAISAKGFGETQPIATNDTVEGRAQNRRTTFTWITQ